MKKSSGRTLRYFSVLRVLLSLAVFGTLNLQQCLAGTLEYAAYSDIKDWNPAVALSLESLMHPGEDGGPAVPALAVSSTQSEDKQSWTFKLRSGVTFHDGTPCDAAAVKKVLERTIPMKEGASYVRDAVSAKKRRIARLS